jgi:hypothetical protein
MGIQAVEPAREGVSASGIKVLKDLHKKIVSYMLPYKARAFRRADGRRRGAIRLSFFSRLL